MVAIGDRRVAVGAEVEPEVPPICSSEKSNQLIRCISELRNRRIVIKMRVCGHPQSKGGATPESKGSTP